MMAPGKRLWLVGLVRVLAFAGAWSSSHRRGEVNGLGRIQHAPEIVPWIATVAPRNR